MKYTFHCPIYAHTQLNRVEYDDREDGMKPVDDMLKNVSYDAVDFGDGCDATIDDKIIGGGDQLKISV